MALRLRFELDGAGGRIEQRIAQPNLANAVVSDHPCQQAAAFQRLLGQRMPYHPLINGSGNTQTAEAILSHAFPSRVCTARIDNLLSFKRALGAEERKR